MRSTVYCVKEALSKFRPQDKYGKPLPEMAGVVKKFLGLANLRLKEVDDEEKKRAPAI